MVLTKNNQPIIILITTSRSETNHFRTLLTTHTEEKTNEECSEVATGLPWTKHKTQSN